MQANGLSAILALGRTATQEAGAQTMDNHATQSPQDSSQPSTEDRPSTDRSLLAARHPVLSRLMEEVRNECNAKAGYDRVHNRHNRGGR